VALKRKLRKLGLLPGLESRPNRISVPESLEVVQVSIPKSIPEIKTRKQIKTRSKSIPRVNKE